MVIADGVEPGITVWDENRAILAGELLKIMVDRKDFAFDDLPRLAGLAREAATVIFPFSVFPLSEKGSAEGS